MSISWLDLASRGVAVAWGQHDRSPSVTVQGFCGSFLEAQSTPLHISSEALEHILPCCAWSSDRTPSLHIGIHNSLRLSLIYHPLNMPKPLHSRVSQLQGDWQLTQPLSKFFVSDEIVPPHSRNRYSSACPSRMHSVSLPRSLSATTQHR